MNNIETMKQWLAALEEAKLHIWLGDEKGVAANVKCHQTITTLRQAIEQAQKQELPQPDSICQEDDGCPTEIAVLQRFWREHQQAQQAEPVAYQDTAKHTELVAAENWENIDPQWHWMYRPLYTSPPPQRKPLTDEEIAELWLDIQVNTPASGVHEEGLQPWRFARAIEAAHGIMSLQDGKGEA